MEAATSTALWKTEEKIPPNTRWRRPGENFINTYEETRKALEEVDAKRNETDLDEKTQKTLEDMVSNGPSCRTRCGVERIKRPALEPVVVPPGVVDPMWCRVVRAKLNLKIRRKWSQ